MTIPTTSAPGPRGRLSAMRRGSNLAMLTTVFAGGNMVSSLLRMASGFLTARLAAPAVLGLFNGLGLVLGYVPFLQFGVLNGLSRELPYYVGRGEQDRVQKLAAAAQAWALIVGGLASAGLLVVAGWHLTRGEWQLAAGWTTQAVGALLLFYSQYYLQITYRTRGDFARLALVSTIQNALALALVILVKFFGFYGLCLRTLAVGVVNLLMLWHWRPVKVQPAWDRSLLWQLFKVGAPIFIVGQIYAWWTVLDSTLVLRYLKAEGLGFYQIAVIVGTTAALLPDAVSQITYPRMAEQFGRTGKLHDLLRMVRRPVLYLTLAVIPVILAGWYLVPPLVQFLLPKYTAGVPAAQWMLVAVGISCLAPVNNAFNIVKRQDFYLIAIASGIATYVGALLWLMRTGAYLAAFPQAMVVGRVVFIVLAYLFLAYLWRRERRAEDSLPAA